MKLFKNKKGVIFSLALSLMSVFVCAISTFAWFQVNEKATPQVNSGSPNLNISSISTTKNLLQSSPDGSTNYSGLSLYERTINSSGDNGTSSENITMDSGFNIPKNGVGYYMVKRNASKEYIYADASTANSGTYKLTTLTNTSGQDASNKAYLNSVNLTAGEMYRFFDYTFKSINNETKTVNQRIKLYGTTSTNNNIDIDSYDLEINVTGNYKLWLDYKTGDVGVEYLGEIISRNSNLKHNKIKRFSGIGGSNTCYILLSNSGTIGTWNNLKDFAIWSTTGSVSSSNKDTATSNAVGFYSAIDNYYYYPISVSTTDLYIKFTQTKNGKDYYNIAHIATQTQSPYSKQTFVADTCYVVNDFKWMEKEDWNKAFWYGGTYDGWDSTYSNNRNVTGLTFSTTTKTFVGSTTKTYYLYTTSFSNPYAHYWKVNNTNYWPSGTTWNGDSMTNVATNLFSIEIPTIYDKVIFSNSSQGSNQTSTLDLPNNDSSKNAFNHSSSTWYLLSDGGSNYTYYFYDPLEIMGSQPYVHYWRSTNEYYGVSGTSATSLLAMTDCSSTIAGLWSVSLSQRIDNMVIANKQNISAGAGNNGIKQTTDITSLTSYRNKYFWLKTTNGSVGGQTNNKYNWQAATNIPSSKTRTYKLFDNKAKLSLNSSEDRYAYVWKNGSSDSSMAHWQLNSWPGIKMTKSTTESYVWYVTISESYDRIIFTNGNPNGSDNPSSQTANLTVGSTGSLTCGADKWYFVLSSSTISSGADAGKWDGQWYEQAHNVGIYAAFILSDGSDSNIAPKEIESDDAFGLAPYTPSASIYSGLAASRCEESTANGAYYYFEKDNSVSEYYSDPECTTPYTEAATSTSGSTIIYVKYLADLSNHTTFYVDTSDSGGLGTKWSNLIVTDTSHNQILSSAATENVIVSDHLYKITLPNTCDFILSGDTTKSQSGYYWSANLSMSTAVSNSSTFLLITANDSGVCPGTWCVDKVESTDKAYVCIKDNTGYITEYKMGAGNNNPNLFIYEEGIVIEQGYQIWFKVGNKDASEDEDYTYYKYDNIQTPSEFTDIFAKDSDDGNIEAVFSGEMRYTFYIYVYNSVTYVSLAEVPLLGNGYYIMETDNANNHNSFSGAKKMQTGTNGGASYGAYEVSNGTMIYIRSYIDAQNTYYSNVSTSNLPAGVEAITDGNGNTTGVIRFTAPNTFNINVSATGVVTITDFTITDDFYKLNELDINVSNQTQIKNQNTSMVVEIAFTANNPEPLSISLELTNGLSNYVGVSLYVTDEKQTDYYDFMRDNCYFDNQGNCLLSNSTSISNLNTGFTTTANSGDTLYYAYILIDYLYSSTYTNSLQYQNGASMASFKLVATQV